jgi:hypothetical protein
MNGLCISIREQVGSSFKTCDMSVTVQNSITDMVKDVANEPSVGLYFVQQHVHKAVPGLLSLKVSVTNSSSNFIYFVYWIFTSAGC